MIPALWLLGAALGIGATVHSGAELRQALPDVVTGWTLIAAGLVAWRRQGPLLAISGFAWFAGNFASPALYLHRGPLLHLLFTDPDGRPRSRFQAVAIVGAYAAAVVAPIWDSEPATLVLCAAALAVGVREYRCGRGAARRRRRDSLVALAALAVVLSGGAIARVAFPGGEADEAALLAYEAVLCAIAVAAAVERRPEPLTDLVVELGERPSDGLRDALSQALGDPTLEVGHWDAASGRYLDSGGCPLLLDSVGRAVTLVERDGAPTAALVHDSALLDDPVLVDALTSAARVALSNAELQARVRAQLGELRRSRGRLLAAADDERRRLEDRLHRGALERLTELSDGLAAAHARGGGAAGTRIERAETLLGRARDDLEALAQGLHPRAILEDGLAGALRSLAESSILPVELDVTRERFDERLEAGAYFVCAEALTNAIKHAGATRAQVGVRREGGRLVVEISDDGVGGVARVDSLADRIDTLGGQLRIESPRGRGTRMTAELPLSPPSASRGSRTAPR